MTIAQDIANTFHDDGQCFRSDAGASLDGICAAIKGVRHAFRDGDNSGDTERFSFPDGSAIIIAGSAWDLALSPDLDCYCFAGLGEHMESCPLAEGGA